MVAGRTCCRSWFSHIHDVEVVVPTPACSTFPNRGTLEMLEKKPTGSWGSSVGRVREVGRSW